MSKSLHGVEYLVTHTHIYTQTRKFLEQLEQRKNKTVIDQPTALPLLLNDSGGRPLVPHYPTSTLNSPVPRVLAEALEEAGRGTRTDNALAHGGSSGGLGPPSRAGSNRSDYRPGVDAIGVRSVAEWGTPSGNMELQVKRHIFHCSRREERRGRGGREVKKQPVGTV